MNLFSVNNKRLYLSLLSQLVLSDFISKRIFEIIASLTGVYTPGGVKDVSDAVILGVRCQISF